MRSRAAICLLFLSCSVAAFAARPAQPLFRASDGRTIVDDTRYRAELSRGAMTFVPVSGPRWSWTLESITAGGRTIDVQRNVNARVADGGAFAEYDRGPALERYVVRTQAVEQQFVLPRPLGDGDLVIEGRIRTAGQFLPTPRGWTWSDRRGVVSLGHVTVFDACGSRIPARMDVGPKSTRITVYAEALATATYPITVDPEIGTQDFRITTMGPEGNTTATALSPAVAYNSVNDEYLVVFLGVDSLGESEVWGQRIDGDGTILGNEFRISTMGSTSNVCCSQPPPYYHVSGPDVVYNATRNEYLVVWRGDDDTSPSLDNDNEIFGQRINASTGAEVGSDDFRISQMGPDAANGYSADSPAVAWDSVNDHYLVVYHGSEDDSGLIEGELEIWARLINGDGTAISSDEVRVSTATPDASFTRNAFSPAVAFDSINKQYLVVWGSDSEPAGDNENEIFAQQMSATAGLVGSNFRVSDMGVNLSTESQAHNAAVVFNPDAGEFLVVWSGDDTVPGDNEIEIFGQRITASTGAEVGTNDFRISEMGPEGNTSYGGSTPAVAYDAATQQYLVVWTGADGLQGDFEAWGQRLSSTGGAVGRSDYKITEVGPEGVTTYQAGDADVATGGSGTMLVIWRGNDESLTSSFETEIFGQRFAMTNTAPVVTVPGTASYTENGAATTLSPTATVVDDSEDFSSGTLTVQYTANGSSDDRLAIFNEGTGSGQIGVSGSDVSYAGTVIGTYTGGTGTTPLVVTFDDDATPAAVQALIQHITFSNVSEDPSTAARTVSFAVNDGDGQTGTVTKSVSVVAVPDPPSITLPGNALSYFKNDPATIIDSGALVTDPDDTAWSEGTLTVSFTANGSSDDSLEIRNEGTSSGQIGVSGANISYGGTTIGTFAGGTGTTALVISFNGSASLAAAQAVARNVTFRNASTNPSTETRTVQFVFTISNVSGGAGTKSITVTALNSAPSLGLPGGGLAWLEDSAAAAIDATATVSDVDSNDLSGGSLTITYTAGGTTDDRLAIRNDGTSAGQIGTSGSNVTYGGTTIGTFTGGSGTTALAITFNSSSTPAAAQALARNITFQNVAIEPPPSSRTVQFAISDGDGGSTAATTTVSIVAVNDAPVVTLPGAAAAYTELDPAVVLDATATVSDNDSSNFSGGTLTIDYSANGSSDDVLAIRSAGNVAVSGANVSVSGITIGTVAGGSGLTPLVLTMNASATPAAVQEVVRNVTYRNTSEAPSTLQRTVRFVLTDGDDGTSLAATKNVTVTGISTAPTVTLSTEPLAYTENGPATVIDATATVSDPDSGNFDTGSVTITLTANGHADDRLAISTTGSITLTASNVFYNGTFIGTFSGGSGTTPLTIALNSSADANSTQALLRNITYAHLSDAPAASRIVQFVVADGDGGTSTPRTITIDITAVNDASTITLGASSPTFVEGDAAVVLAPNTTVTDADSPNFDGGTFTIDLIENATSDDRLLIRNDGTGAGQIGVSGSNVTYAGTVVATFAGGVGTAPLVLTLNANATLAIVQAAARNITFSNVSDTPSLAGRSVRFVVLDGDGGTSNSATTAVNITATNDVPVVTLPSGALTYNEGAAAAAIDAAATVTDVDSFDLGGGNLTVSLTNATADDRLQIRNDGTAAGQIGTSGSNVTYGGTTIGTYTGGTGTANLVVTFNAASTFAAAQALARNITFHNVSLTPSTITRIANLVVNDGDGGASDAATKTINVISDGCATTTSKYGITGTTSFTAGAAASITVTALDSSDATVTCYTGTVRFTSTDSAATLPSDYTFITGEGSHAFNVTMRTPGTQTITATDTVNASITKSWVVTVKGSTTTTLSSSPNPSLQGQSVTLTATVTSTSSGTISGTVTFFDAATSLGTGTISAGTATLTTSSLSTGTHSLTAVYGGNDNFLNSTSSVLSHTVNVTSSGGPAVMVATTLNGSQVALSWTAVSGASGYDIFRGLTTTSFVYVGTVAGLSATDSGLASNTTYLYKVRVTGGSAFSPADAATTMVFTDSTLTANTTPIRATHITELRTAVNAMRTAAGLTAATFTDPSLTSGTTLRRVHITELRTALDAARTALGLATISYSDATIVAGSTTMKRAHVTELRAGTQ